MLSMLTAPSWVWHCACSTPRVLALSLLSSCFYLVPVPWAAPHPSPEVEQVTPEADSTVSMTSSGQTFLVVVSDTETVNFIWSLSRDGYVGTATPVAQNGDTQGSQVKLAYDTALDGQTLTCVASDTLSEDVTIRWQLEVL